jgi:hypothetical protein
LRTRANPQAEFKVSSLEKQLASKVEENKELTKMCDELISKLG